MRVFVLSTGRCGTTTFTYACKHMTNFTAGHETRARYVGAERLDYPDNHIEIDNRLSWFLGRLDRTYGDDPYFVHLTRDKAEVAESYAQRMSNPLSIGVGHKRSILMDAPYEDVEICLDVAETMLANIEHFLRDKTKVMSIALESIEEDFLRFWDWIGATGDKAAALSEWNIRYNDRLTKHGQIQRSARPATEIADLREKCRDLGEKNRRLRTAISKESGKLEHADEVYRESVARLVKTERKLAEANAEVSRIDRASKQEVSKLRQEIESRDQEMARLKRDSASLKEKLSSFGRVVESRIKERDAFVKYADELEARYRDVLKSRTWKMMGPYRLLMRRVKKAFLARPAPPNSVPARPALEVESGDKRRASGGVSGRTASVQALDDKLWGGFSRSAFQDLVAVRDDFEKSPKVRSDAAYRLARWHSVHGECERALEEIRAMRTVYPPSGEDPRQFIPEALFLCRLGRVDEARDLLAAYEGFNSTIQLMLANTWNPAISGTRAEEGEKKVLEHLNAIYEKFGVALVEKRDPSAPLSIDNIRGASSGIAVRDAREKVTVIVPVFNAQDTIVTALTSIAEQTWSNLEVLVIDDASTDNSVDIISEYCARDDRFRLIRGGENVGSYVCRNKALELATGDFVTVHDSDDWSHPDKIKCQMDSMRNNPSPYNLAMWVRTTSQLAFFGNSRTLHNLVRADHSSGFFPRETLRRYGAWDAVRVSADTELFWRIESALGNKKWMLNRRQILNECPLAIGRMSETSLTQAAATQVMTIYHGLRKEYRDAADCWHSDAKEVDDATPSARRKSFFPVPSMITPDAASGYVLTTLVIADWNSPEMIEKGLSLLRQVSAAGSAGLLHYPHYRSNVAAPLKQLIRRFAWDNGISVLAPGESARVERVIIPSAGIFEHALDRFPKIEYERLFVVGGAGVGSAHEPAAVPYDGDRVREHLVEFFGIEGEWVSTVEEAIDHAAKGVRPTVHPQVEGEVIGPA